MATAGGLEIHEQLSHAAPTASAGQAPAADLEPLPVASAARVADVPPIVRPRNEGSRPAVPVLAVAIVVLLLSGIASAFVRGDGVRSTLALVQSAGASTSETKTARMAITLKSDAGEFAKGVTVDGAFDFENHRGLMQMDAAQFGAPEMGKIDIIFDYSSGLVMYMKFPPAFAREFGNKPWVKLDVASLSKMGGGVDVGALMQGQSNDPMSGLALLKEADDVDNVGKESVRGVETTHYRLQVSLDEAAGDAVPELQKLTGGKPLPMDVWIDADDHVRRFEMTIDSSALGEAGAPHAGGVTIAFDLYDFGAPVDTAPPPANQVTNFEDVLKRAGG